MASPQGRPGARSLSDSAKPVWTLHEMAEVDSTNDEARRWPAWHAIRASGQRAGRGRFGRSWNSGEGGLWLSAVLPTGAREDALRLVPLIAADAVLQALQPFSLPALRLRWPNDLLVHERKLAGLLVECMEGGRPVVGVGLNVSNEFVQDPELRSTATRLADWVHPCPSLLEIAPRILEALADSFQEAQAHGVEPVLQRLATFWGPPRRVVLDLDGREEHGVFEGIDSAGRVRLRAGNRMQAFDARQVRRLREY